MNWWNFLAIVTASWCGVDIGIAIKEKDTKSIIFNGVIMLLEWAYILFNVGNLM